MFLLGRSSPRPTKACTWKTISQQASGIPKQWPSRNQKHSRLEESSRLNHHVTESESVSDPRRDMNIASYASSGSLRSRSRAAATEARPRPLNHEFSDAASSSDWSLFTSSDEAASFTTESTRDSFSTVDYADATNMDPFSSILSSLYASEYHPQKTIACNMFSTSKSQTRFFSENMGTVWECYAPEDSFSSGEAYGNVTAGRQGEGEGEGVKYGSGTRRGAPQNYVNCNI